MGSRPRDPGVTLQTDSFTTDLIRLIPEMRRRAMFLTRHADHADDLLQGALLRALRNRDRFEPGSNLRAWFSVILRHEMTDRWRSTRREVAYDQDRDIRFVEPEQENQARLSDLHLALQALAPEKRQALLAIAVAGLAYEEAADRIGCSSGTLKSRVSRARRELQDMLETGRLSRHAATSIERAAGIVAEGRRRDMAAA